MRKEKRFFIHTFGCQMNEYDSTQMESLLFSMGFERARRYSEADIIIINTCSVRKKAEQKVFSLIGRLRALKRAKPHIVIIISGCVAQSKGERVIERFPHVDIVIGTRAYSRLKDILIQVIDSGQGPICDISMREDFSSSLSTPVVSRSDFGIKAYITVMQGCDNYCTYCIVPYVRGREVSRTPRDIICEAEYLATQGVKEITLLGQNVNSYGRGLETYTSFTDLLKMVSTVNGIERIRFVTSHPKDLSIDLMEAFGSIPKLCEHLHLPVQSGSNKILRKMRRRYTRENYLEKIEKLRSICPDITLTTDVIVGFPGETEEDFMDTYHLIEEVKFENIFSFVYSDRSPARAVSMRPKVDYKVAIERLKVLQELQRNITLAKHKSLEGSKQEILVDGYSAHTEKGQLSGRTRGNLVVNFEGSKNMIGSIVTVEIIKGYQNSLLGRLCFNQDEIKEVSC